MVATYDKAPKMSAKQVTNSGIRACNKGEYSLIVMNYANPDMVGHTGKMDATITALEEVDHELGRLLSAIGRVGRLRHFDYSGSIGQRGNTYAIVRAGRVMTLDRALRLIPVPFILVGRARG